MLPENTERTAAVGQPLTIDLQAIPGAGYMWEIETSPPALEVQENKVVAQSEEVGGPSTKRRKSFNSRLRGCISSLNPMRL